MRFCRDLLARRSRDSNSVRLSNARRGGCVMNEVERSFSVAGHEVSSRSFGCAGVATNPLQEYWVDAFQRFILTLDALRQRGNNYLERAARISLSVVNATAETLMDGRTFERPVNYVLVRIKPPAG